MNNPKSLILALPLLGVALAGCGSGGNTETITKAQEQELRNPSHVPPAGYRRPASAGVSPAPASSARPPSGG